tara:strand:- start:7621 stop:9840 length:2220 start_codon:yes stop_codon:yes gene_type:complete
VILAINSIRSRFSNQTIISGYPIDADARTDGSRPTVVKVGKDVLSTDIFQRGQIWSFEGKERVNKITVNNITFNERTIIAEKAEFLKPSGEQLKIWLSSNVSGIGNVKAERLWNKFGEELYEILDNGERDKFSDFLNETVSDNLFEAWDEHGDSATLKFINQHKIPLGMSLNYMRFHKKNTIAKLKKDPYSLLSFSATFNEVDKIARESFLISREDPRRFAAAIEHSLYDAFEEGHTCMLSNSVERKVRKKLDLYDSAIDIEMIIEYGKEVGAFVTSTDQQGQLTLHPSGAYLMEKVVAEFSRSTTANDSDNFTVLQINDIVTEFEESERVAIGVVDFKLNTAQFEAILTVVQSQFSVITGGAGVGKTTVLKGLYKVLDKTGRPRFQMALSGRATARMGEATNEPAITIASFLQNITEEELGLKPIIIIDEASMLDLVTFYRLIKKIPAQSKVILVGDPYQLPPIGAGLIFHAFCDLDSIPKAELTIVKRQSKDSAIPVVAKSVRDGAWPSLSSNETADVCFISCGKDLIASTVERLYLSDTENTQILTATRLSSTAGMTVLNKLIQSYKNETRCIKMQNEFTGVIENTDLRYGDRIIYITNDWERNLQNGSLGQITAVYEKPRLINTGTDDEAFMEIAVGEAVYEGIQHYILDRDVDNIELSYAITVHKAQGSQFPRVIIPVVRSRIIDRTFIYTAITRAQKQVILVGDESVIRDAVRNPPIAFQRQVGINTFLKLGG